jgi:hypothetical protein
MSARPDAKALQALAASRGWGVLREVMEREIVAAAMAIAENPAMSLDEINFRRGSIWAAKQLLDTPEKLLRKLETDLLIEESRKAAATAADRTTPDGPDA